MQQLIPFYHEMQRAKRLLLLYILLVIQPELDNIAGASVPYAVLEYNMYNSMLNMVGDGKMTPTEAGEWVVTQWNQYLNQLNVWEPFWDVNFNNSIRLYGDLPDE